MLVSPPPPMRAGLPVVRHAGRQRGQRGEAAVGDRQVLDGARRNGERALAALRLNDGGFGLDHDGVGQAADLDGDGPTAEPVAGADGDARLASMVLKPVMLTWRV